VKTDFGFSTPAQRDDPLASLILPDVPDPLAGIDWSRFAAELCGGAPVEPPAVEPEQSSTSTITRRVKNSMLNLEGKAGRAADLIRLPRRVEVVHIVNDGELEGVTIILALLAKLKAPAAAWISTLGANRATACLLAQRMMTGDISRLTFLASVYFRDADPDEAATMAKILEHAGARVAFVRTHAKVWLLQTRAAAIVCEGSANLRSCRNLEQVNISNSRKLLNFHRRWIERHANGNR